MHDMIYKMIYFNNVLSFLAHLDVSLSYTSTFCRSLHHNMPCVHSLHIYIMCAMRAILSTRGKQNPL